ncbi:MAG: hypothetical protein IJU33_00130 [Bacteroidales bacterium]|nr:hypothetical protein [Bacteroidales bacterium]
MKGILVDDNGDLMISGGRLVIGDNRAQVAQHLIGAFAGEYKHAPMLGGNARNMIAGQPDPFWVGSVKSQLKQCLVEVERVIVEDGEVVVELKVES